MKTVCILTWVMVIQMYTYIHQTHRDIQRNEYFLLLVCICVRVCIYIYSIIYTWYVCIYAFIYDILIKLVYKSPPGTSGNVSLKWSYVEVFLLAEEKFQCSWEWRPAVKQRRDGLFFP